MKSLSEYITDTINESKCIIVDFADITDEGYNNLLSEITKQCPNLISPEEEEFDYQRLTIDYDKNLVTLVMPNNFTNDSIGSPLSLTFVYKIKGDIAKDYIAKNKDFTTNDFKEVKMPKYFDRVDARTVKQYREELPKLLALVMNRQPEPLW